MKRAVKIWVHRDERGRLCCASFLSPPRWFVMQPGSVRLEWFTPGESAPKRNRKSNPAAPAATKGE